MVQRSQTSSLTPRLSEAARYLVLPSGIVSTAWPSVHAECARLGIEFDPWQEGAAKVILAKRADGMYAASVGSVVISIPRQVGKTFLIGALIFALCMLNPGMLVIWTAHQLKTSSETFKAMQAFARGAKIAPFIRQVYLGSGSEEVAFKNGSRILFGARERGFGLGFTKVSVLVIDEAQRVTDKTMDDLIPTTNQAENPLIFMVGTPPRPTDAGEVFRRRRREALSGESDDMVYLEFSAEADVDASTWTQANMDWEAVAKANPSFPLRTGRVAILRMLKNLGRESFRREGLGVWDDDRASVNGINPTHWSSTAIAEAPAGGIRSFGVAFSADGMRLALAGATRTGDSIHVELIDGYVGAVEGGLAPLADWFMAKDAEGVARWRKAAAIVLSGRAGASVLAQLLFDRGVPRGLVTVATTPQYFDACAMFDEAVATSAAAVAAKFPPTLTHKAAGQQQLDDGIAVAGKKARGQGGAWGWSATTPDGDETPVEAVSLANWGARTSKRVPRDRGEKRKAVIL